MAKDKAAKNKKPNIFKRIGNYFREVFIEIKKITWPTPKTTTKNFLIVITVILIAGLFICALDRGLYALLNLVMATGTH